MPAPAPPPIQHPAGGDRHRVLEFGILGPLDVRRDGRPVDVPGPRVRQLLLLLLLEPGAVVSATRLVDGLWPERPPNDAANALQTLASRLRRALGDASVVEARAGGYRVAVEPDAVDARCFERLAADGRAALAAEDPDRAASLLERALALWRGDALAELRGADAGRAAATRLEQLRLDVLAGRLEADLVRGRHDEAVPALTELVAAHPLDERLRALLLRALLASGRRADALALYESTRRLLRDELGAHPAPELQRLHREALRQDVPDPASAPTNLRAQLTSFVGRDADLDGVVRLLRSSRLVTVVGPGGTGKTRLAVELGARQVSDWPDGVWLVELAAVTDPRDVPAAVLDALRLGASLLPSRQEVEVRDPVQRLVAALGRRRVLLLVDNCEHVVEAAARLVETVLANCPEVRVVTTSREALQVPGESLWPLQPLALPDASAAPDEAAGFAAIRLFLDRAAAVRPGFALDPGQAAAAVQICRRLDGQPLAIELAAARLRSLSVEQVAARLDDRFTLLAGGSRTAVPRHQTLRAVVDWSWDLLDARERILLRRLAVFAGGVTLDSAERVCAGEGLPADVLLAALGGLVDRSLVEAAEVDGAMRYRLLETIRAYAADRLDEAGEAGRVRAGHAAWFSDLAETTEPLLRTRDQLDWLVRLDREHENFRAALRWAVDTSQAELAQRIAGALGTYWALRGRRAEAGEWLSAAMALPGGVDPWVEATAAFQWVLSGPQDITRLDTAVETVRRVRDQYELSGRPPHPLFRIVVTLFPLLLGQLDEARAQMAAMLADDSLDAWSQAAARLAAAQVSSGLAELDAAERHATDAVERFRALGERLGLSQALTVVAEIAGTRSDVATAQRALEETLRLLRELGSREDVASLLIRLGSLESLTGSREQGDRRIEEGIRLATEVGSRNGMAWGAFFKARVLRHHGDLEAAHELLVEALRGAPNDHLPPTRAIMLVALGFVVELQGDPAEASRLHLEALDFVTEGLSLNPLTRGMVSMTFDGLAGASLAQGDAPRAATLLGAADALRGAFQPRGEDRVDLDRITAGARKRLGAEDFERARALGASMSAEEAVELARAKPIRPA